MSNYRDTGITSYGTDKWSPAELFIGDDECPDAAAFELELIELAEWAGITESQAWDFWYAFSDMGFIYELVDEVTDESAAASLKKSQTLKTLIEDAGDDFNTLLCSLGEDATRQREAGRTDEVIDSNIETLIDNKIDELAAAA